MTLTIEQINADEFRDDTQPIWNSTCVHLFNKNQTGQLLATFDATTPNLIQRITEWCRKTGYRCKAIRDGRIWL